MYPNGNSDIVYAFRIYQDIYLFMNNTMIFYNASEGQEN